MDSCETRIRGTGMLPPQPLGDLLWRPIVIKFGGDQARQLRIGGQLAYFRTPRPLGRSSIGSLRPVRVAATIADDLPSHRRRPVDPTSDRSRRQACRDPTRHFFTLDQGHMTGPALPPNRRDPTRLTQEPPDPRQRFAQRALHFPDRITTAPHHPQQILLLDAEPDRTTPSPASTHHIIDYLQ
jgi:hypothetical protein